MIVLSGGIVIFVGVGLFGVMIKIIVLVVSGVILLMFVMMMGVFYNDNYGFGVFGDEMIGVLIG